MNRADAQFPSHGLGRHHAVAGCHDDINVGGTQRCESLGGSRFDGIGYRQQAGAATIHRQQHDAGTRAALLFRHPGNLLPVNPMEIHQGGITQRQLVSVHHSRYPDATVGGKILHRVKRHLSLARFAHDSHCQRMLTSLIETCRELQHLFVAEGRSGDHAAEAGPTLGECAGLVHHHGVNLAHGLYRRGIPKQDALGRRAPGRHHDRHGRRQAQRTGAGDDQHRHRVDQTEHPAGFRADNAPCKEGKKGNDHDHHDEIPGHDISQALHGSAGALCLRHQRDNTRQGALGADLFRAHDQRAAGVECGTDHLLARPLGYRQWLTGQHRFVDRAAALLHHAIYRHLLTWSNAQAVTDMDMAQRNILFFPVRTDATSDVRRQLQQ